MEVVNRPIHPAYWAEGQETYTIPRIGEVRRDGQGNLYRFGVAIPGVPTIVTNVLGLGWTPHGWTPVATVG